MTRSTRIRDITSAAESLVKGFREARLATRLQSSSAATGAGQQGFASRAAAFADLVLEDLDGGRAPHAWLAQNQEAVGEDFGQGAQASLFQLLTLFNELYDKVDQLRAVGLEAEHQTKLRDANPAQAMITTLELDRLMKQHSKLVSYIAGPEGALDPVDQAMSKALGDLKARLV